MWLLFILLTGTAYPNITVIEFSDQRTCEQGKQQILNLDRSTNLQAICIPKGQR